MSTPVSPAPIPDEVRRFLAASIPSVPYLEAVLLLRSEPDTGWTPAKLSSRLYVRPREAADLLRELAGNGLAQAGDDAQFRYTQDEELRGVLDEVAATYATHLFEVTELIHSKGDKRARVFAQAFRIRKDD